MPLTSICGAVAAVLRAGMDTMTVKMQAIEKRKALVAAQASVDADALATAAKSSGLSPDQVIAWKRAQALSALANSKAGVLVNVK